MIKEIPESRKTKFYIFCLHLEPYQNLCKIPRENYLCEETYIETIIRNRCDLIATNQWLIAFGLLMLLGKC